MTDALPSDFIADGDPFENPHDAADVAYAATVPSLGAKLGADLGDGITMALGRAAQRGQQQGASWFDRLATLPDPETAAGMVAGGQDPYAPAAASPTISAEEANRRFAPPGATIADGPMSEGLTRVIGRQKADEIRRDGILGRYAAGHGAVTNFGVGTLGFMLDPLQAASAFVPGLGEESIAAHLGEGLIGRTASRAVAGASAGAAATIPLVAAKYALGTEQASDYGIRDAMFDMAAGVGLGALGHAGFGALRDAGLLKPDGLIAAERARAAAGLREAEAPTGLVSNEDLAAVADAPADARSEALQAGVAQMLDGRPVDVAPIFDQVRAERAEAELQRWTARQGRLDAQSTAALRASSLSDAAAGTVESRAAVLQTRLDDLRGQHAGFLADIERAEAQRTAQVDTVTPQRLQAIDAEMADPALSTARRQQLERERSMLTEGRDPAADALEAARTEAELRGLQRGAAALQAEMDRTAGKVAPLQAKAAAQRAAGSDALQATSDRIGGQEGTLRFLAARSIRRYAGAFGADVTRDEADALARRVLRGGAGETAKVVAEIRGRTLQGAPAGSRAAAPPPASAALAGPPIEQQRAVIANDVARQLVAAGRPEREARVSGRIVAAHYEARASRFGGTLGTAEELYRSRAAEIRGPDQPIAPEPSPAGGDDGGGAVPTDNAMVQMLADRGSNASQNPSSFDAEKRDIPVSPEVTVDNRPSNSDLVAQGAPQPGAPIPGLDIAADVAPGEPAAPEPAAVEAAAAASMPEAVEPIRAAVAARDAVEAAAVQAEPDPSPEGTLAAVPDAGQPAPLPAYSPAAVTPAATRGADDPAGVFMFDPTTLAVDAERFQFKADGDASGVTGALRGVTRWDPAKAQALMVWEQRDGRLFVADGHQRAGLAHRLTERGEASGLQLPGILYREADGISADDMRAMAAVTNIANGSGSALDGAKVLRARPDLMDGSVPLSAGKGQQAAALARLDDAAFRMVVNAVVPENFGAVVGQMLPEDGARQVAALTAIARFEPRSVEEATALTQRVASAELARAEAGRQGSLFGDLDAPESTAGEEMRIVARVIRDLRRDRGLFSRVVANASRLEEAGSTIERGAARSAATDAGAFAKILASDAYAAGPTRTALIEAAKELRDGTVSIGDASGRLYAAVRRQAEDDGLDRAGARRGDAASEGDALDRAGGDRRGAPDAATGDGAAGDAAAARPAGRRVVGDRGRAGDRAEAREGVEDATVAAGRGGAGDAARRAAGDGVGDLLGRLIGDDAADPHDPLDDRLLNRGDAGEASIVAALNELLGRKPADVSRPSSGGDDLLDEIARRIADHGSAPVASRLHPDLIEAGDHVIHRFADAEDSRHYRVYPRPAGGLDGVAPGDLGDRIGVASLGQHEDGRWEVGNLKIDKAHRRQGIARKLYAAIEQDLGIAMRPSGQLLADGYAMWRARDPEAVKWHREVGSSFYSPKMLKAEAEMMGGQALGPAFRAAYDALPDEAKTPEAMATMFQRRGGADLGSITFRPGDRPLLRLMADADASTFVHEMGHDWLEQMMRDADHPAAPEAFRADAAAVRGWLGNDDGTLTEAQHERFATGFEQYLRAGVAPTPELAGAFAQFRDWLTRIYRTVRGLGAEISPDIRAVFDRLLTPEPQPPAVPARPDVAALAQRQQAVYRAGYAPGMPQAEFDALNATVYGAKMPSDAEVRAAAPAATSTARAADPEGTAAAGTPARTAADATLAAWQQRFDAAGVVPSAEERALIEATRARVEAADLAAEGYAQAGACLTAAGV